MIVSERQHTIPRKRKSKVSNPPSSQVEDLNVPAVECSDIVPTGLVSSRVNQLDGGVPAASDELTKKQKTNKTQSDARSVAAASVSPCRAQ